MPIPARFLATAPGIAMLGAAVLLAGCGDSKKPTKAEGDPALSGALGDQIMVDPDLAGQNQSGDGVSAGSNSVELPPEQHKRFGDYLRKHGQAMVRGVEVDDGTHTKSKA